MCGIVGYVGPHEALPILKDGLKRLEYRGYDSAGICMRVLDRLEVRKKAGKVDHLFDAIAHDRDLAAATMGMGHSRWATHGQPNEINAHPHGDCSGRIMVVHNGIIENYSSLRARLQKHGHTLRSETDTEVLAHMIEYSLSHAKDLGSAVRQALREVKGTYGIVVMDAESPDSMVAARMGSPLLIGVGEDEHIVASDAAAIVKHTKNVVYLNDGEVAVVSSSSVDISTVDDEPVTKEVEQITIDLEQIEKGGYDHFMLKEIHEQPETIRDGMRGRLLEESSDVKLGGLSSVEEQLKGAERLILIGCGTSWHAGLVGEYLFEQIAGVPTEVEYASEFRYRNPIVKPGDVVLCISQSGETADTLAALREAKKKGATVLGVVNVVGSSIARETDAGVYIHAGPEIGVASTKAFTSQLTALSLITILLAKQRAAPPEKIARLVKEMASIPEKVSQALTHADEIRVIAEKYARSPNALFLGRGANFPTALEGALKLKEISYVHAEGYPASEMKHGPIALIDENMPVVCVVPQDAIYEKVLSNIQEVKARKGKVIAVANDDDEEITNHADHVLRVPRTYGYFGPIVNIIPLQLLSYYVAVARGTNVDQPRNLAKSVTVE